jgi:hypothetical protein
LRSRVSLSILLACAAALASIAAPGGALANSLTVCKQTNPADPSGTTQFHFTGANGFPGNNASGFNQLYLGGGSSFPLTDSTGNPAKCKVFNLTGHDQFNKITESPLPPGWSLSNVSCTHVKSAVTISGATASVDVADPNVTCTFVNSCAATRQDLSTGVKPWQVTLPSNATVATTAVGPNSNWASQSPGGGPFPAGTSWVQPGNSTSLIAQAGGTYTYRLRFTVTCPTTVQGWFAADNTAVLTIDSNVASCNTNANNNCFLQAAVKSFGPWPVGPGGHVITIQVNNLANSLTGLLAHITVP